MDEELLCTTDTWVTEEEKHLYTHHKKTVIPTTEYIAYGKPEMFLGSSGINNLEKNKS